MMNFKLWGQQVYGNEPERDERIKKWTFLDA